MSTTSLYTANSTYNFNQHGAGNGFVQEVIFNQATTLNGVHKEIVVTSSATGTYTLRAVITDSAGNVMNRGPNQNFSLSTASGVVWCYMPFSSPLSMTANASYYIGYEIVATPAAEAIGLRGFNDYNSRVSPDAADGTHFTTSGKQGEYVGISGSVIDHSANSYVMSIGVSITFNRAPNAPINVTLSGGNGPNFNNSNTLTFGWTATDPDGDTLTAYHVVGSHDNWVTFNYDSGAIACNIASGGTFSHALAASSLIEANNWVFNAAVQDSSGVWSAWGPGFGTVNIDKTLPAAPTVTVGTATSATIPLTWTAFSDGAMSSGFLDVYVYARTWNGTAWVDIPGSPVVLGNVTSYTYTGLTANTQYQIIVRSRDKAVNWSNYNTYTVTTNALPTTYINNLASAGYLIDQTPTFVVGGNDVNTQSLELHIQVSTVSNFASLVIDTWAAHTKAAYPGETGNDGWAVKGTVPNGSTNKYTSTVTLAPGTYYARAQAWDGIEAGSFGPTYTFTVQAKTWPTVIGANDTIISKRAIDDLRTTVNSVRQARNLSTKTWTDPTLTAYSGNTPGNVNIRKIHLDELRTAIQDIYTALGLGTIAWTDPTIAAYNGNIPGTNRKGAHWQELRTTLLSA